MTTGTVIHGTLRTRDLIEAFGRELLRINPKCNCEYVQALVDNPESGDEFDLENLFDTLNYIAPEGYYFGAHEGDGSDFGFWQCEE